MCCVDGGLVVVVLSVVPVLAGAVRHAGLDCCCVMYHCYKAGRRTSLICVVASTFVCA